MKIYFCEKCGISIPLQEVVAGKATARDGKTYCTKCKPGEAGEADDLKLYFCDNCGVSIPLQDVIHNRARTVGEDMFCTNCGILTQGQRAARKDRVEQERKEKEESRYRLHFCDRCTTSIPQSHLVTGRAVVRGGRTYCERCKGRGERPGISTGAAVALVAVLAVLVVGGLLALGGGRKLFGGGPSQEETARREEERAKREEETAKREEALRDQIEKAVREQVMGEVDALLVARGKEESERAAALRERSEELKKDIGSLGEVAEGILAEHAALKSEVGKRLEEAHEDFVELRETLSALIARITELERRPGTGAPPPAGGGTDRVPGQPEPRPEGRPDPPAPAEEEAPPEVKEWIAQLSDKDAGVRFSAAVELGKSGHAGASEALARVLTKDKDTFVRRAAARSLGELGAWSSVPVLIDTLEDREVFVATTASQALKTITDQDFGFREGLSRSDLRRVVQKAKSWWETHEDDR